MGAGCIFFGCTVAYGFKLERAPASLFFVARTPHQNPRSPFFFCSALLQFSRRSSDLPLPPICCREGWSPAASPSRVRLFFRRHQAAAAAILVLLVSFAWSSSYSQSRTNRSWSDVVFPFFPATSAVPCSPTTFRRPPAFPAIFTISLLFPGK